MPGNAGNNAARVEKAKVSKTEGSAVAAALKVVKAQARADAAAEKKVTDAALKVATEPEGSVAAASEKKVADAALKVAAAQAKADAAVKNPYAGFE